jgi:hypothetical protein
MARLDIPLGTIDFLPPDMVLRNRIEPCVLRGDRYIADMRNEEIHEMNLSLLTDNMDRPTACDAVRNFRTALAKAILTGI